MTEKQRFYVQGGEISSQISWKSLNVSIYQSHNLSHLKEGHPRFEVGHISRNLLLKIEKP